MMTSAFSIGTSPKKLKSYKLNFFRQNSGFTQNSENFLEFKDATQKIICPHCTLHTADLGYKIILLQPQLKLKILS